ncbi:MAG: M15 family metallopeptidase [Flavobacteriaceae bacterium]|nr:M15 family metallopeptidase [Flavobacteriaceae bacterium]
MKRSNFIKLFLAILNFPSITKGIYNNNDLKNLLIGKGTPLLVGNNFLLLPEVAKAYIEMKKNAEKENIKLKIVSSYRSFNHQKKIWNKKYKKNVEIGLSPNESIKKIIQYSTIPGTSRHHWGTDMDLIDSQHKVEGDVLITKLFENSGPYYKMNQWMDGNAKNFGFYKVYTNEMNRKGFLYEPWHYSYANISSNFLDLFLKIDILKILKKEENLLGKKFFDKSFIDKYIKENILGISEELLK